MVIEGDGRGIRVGEKEEGSEMKVEVRKCSRRLIEFCSNLVGRKGYWMEWRYRGVEDGLLVGMTS